MLGIDEDTFAMISGLVVIAVAGIAALLALASWVAAGGRSLRSRRQLVRAPPFAHASLIRLLPLSRKKDGTVLFLGGLSRSHSTAMPFAEAAEFPVRLSPEVPASA